MSALAPVAGRPVAGGPLEDRIIGIVAVTEADDVASSTAVIDIAGVVAVTEADDVASSAGAIAIDATAAIVEADDTVAGTIAAEVSGLADITEADDVSSGAVAVDITGAADITEADDTVQSQLLVVYQPGGGSRDKGFLRDKITYQEWKLRERKRKRDAEEAAREKAGDDLVVAMAQVAAIHAAEVEDEETYLLLLAS